MRRVTCTILGLLAASSASTAFATQPGVRLTDAPDAIFDYANGTTIPTVSNGPTGEVNMNFQLGGAPLAPNTNWIHSGNWFYRFDGMPMERQLADVGNSATMTLNGTNFVRYDFPQLYTGPATGPGTSPAAGLLQPDTRAWMTYEVFDTGIDRAKMTMSLCVENYGQQSHTIDLFAVLDIDAMATFTGDNYAPMSMSGTDRILAITDGLGFANVIGHGADFAFAGSRNSVLGPMLNTSVTNFSDLLVPVLGATDNAAVMQYSKLLNPGPPVCSNVDVEIGIAPEPATLLLLAVGGLIARRRARA